MHGLFTVLNVEAAFPLCVPSSRRKKRDRRYTKMTEITERGGERQKAEAPQNGAVFEEKLCNNVNTPRRMNQAAKTA